jgi:hypothetical protein
MASMTFGVVGRQSMVGVGGEVSQSPRFSASLIDLRSLGFVGAQRVLVPVPPFIVALRERGPNAIHGRRLRSGRELDRFPDPEIRRSLSSHFSRYAQELRVFTRTRASVCHVRAASCKAECWMVEVN